MPDAPLRVLLVEDNRHEADLLRATLAMVPGAALHLEPVDRLAPALGRLAQGGLDLVLLDLTLPDSAGLETVDRVHGAAPDLPIIVLTGLQDEQLGVQAVQHGAQDYLVKGRMDGPGLARAIRFAYERRQGEETRAALRRKQVEVEKLQEMDAWRRRILNVAAHELRTPLTPIKIQLHLLKMDLAEGNLEDTAGTLEILVRNFDRLNRLVEDILDVARLESGSLRLARAPLDPVRIVSEVVDAYRPVLQRGGVTLETDLQPCPAVDADGQRMGQIVFNLLSNAVKFTPRGGRIEVRLAPDADGVRVEVRDSGRGLRKEDMQKLFQPFTQVADEGDVAGAIHSGSGLGLYISRSIVEAHGGKIGCESAGPSQGCTFWFTLPAPSLPAAVETASVAPAESL